MTELSKALTIIGLLGPFGASAMGIGDIRSNSALNQTLNAEIPLVLSGTDKLDTIQVRLASPEAFDKAGVERLHALTQLRFKPVAKPDGRNIIQVSSRDVIQEPFLDFLVEVESPQGTLLREFTLLLDPPRGIMQAAGGPGSVPDTPVSRYQPTIDEASGYWNAPPPSARLSLAGNASAHPYAPPSRRAPPTAITQDQLTGETYGPVRRGETLFDIARRIDRPDSVTAGQMAMALYLANPRAFSRNIHGLQAGSRLRIPTGDFIASLGADGSDGAVAMPAEARSGSRQRSAFAAPPAGAGQTRGTSAVGTESAGAVAEVSSRVPSALKKENEELRERLSQLEQRLETAQRLLALKNAELATLQNHHSPSVEPEPVAPPTTAMESSPAPITPPVQSIPLPAAPAPPPRPTIAVKPVETPTEEPFIAPGYWLGSGGLALLGLGVWLYLRRRGLADSADASGQRVTARAPILPDDDAVAVLTTPVGFSEPAFTLEDPDEELSELDPLWEADVYLRYGRYPQAESLIREAIKQNPEQRDLKLKLFEIFSQANLPESFRAYALELRGSPARLPVTFWSAVHALQPEWLPPDIAGELDSASPANSPAVPVADRLSSASEEIALNLEDTDFTAELRALEAQCAVQVQRRDTDTPGADTALAVELSLEPPGDIADDSNDAPAFTLAELAATLPAQGDGLPVEMPDTNDTDFTEELRALEAQYAKPDAVAAPVDPSANLDQPGFGGSDSSRPGELPDTGAAAPSADNLLEFVPPSPADLASTDSNSGPQDHPGWQPGNLISFDTFDLPPARGVIKSRQEPAVAANQLKTTEDLVEFAQMTMATAPTAAGQDPSFGALDFDLELCDPGQPAASAVIVPINRACGEAPLDVTRTDDERGETAPAREALQDVPGNGDGMQQAEAEALLNKPGKVRLSLVPPHPRAGPDHSADAAPITKASLGA